MAYATPAVSIDLDKLQALRAYENKKTVAYKTVDTFAGLTKKKLWLKDGPQPATDGNQITVPFDNPDFYRLVEHELSHVLFRSDVLAKRAFVTEYSDRIQAFAAKNGLVLEREVLHHMLEMIIGLLEDERVGSLWGLLYPGSYLLMKRMNAKYAAAWLPSAHKSIVYLMGAIAGGLEPPPGKLDAFVPIIKEALSKVQRKGFAATLALSKWMVSRMVDQILREMQEQEQEQQQQQKQQQAGGSGQGKSKGQKTVVLLQPSNGTSSDQDSQPDDGSDRGQGDIQPTSAGGTGQGQPQQQPQQGKGTAQQRCEALKSLLESAPLLVMPNMPLQPNDVQESKFKPHGAQAKAEAMARAAANVGDAADELEQFLNNSAKEMEGIIREAKSNLQNIPNEDEWLKKDARAKVVFNDVSKKDGIQAKTEQEDLDTIRRLRAIFNRVMGKRQTSLEDSGTEIDPAAYIERKATGAAIPCFKHEELGRGFKSMIVMDRSGSMSGTKTDQTIRTANVISKAMKYPFVRFDVWGFQSHNNGQVDITRFPTDLAIFDSTKHGVGGCTPLHVAIRLAVRQLEAGTEAKQLIVVSDGFPVFRKYDGGEYSTSQLMSFVRTEVTRARMKNINVTSVMIGTQEWDRKTYFDVTDKDMRFMFGATKNWRKVRPDTFGRDLVKLVVDSFIEYLSNN